ncbi:MAG: PSD1 domain-containing protein [Candidatus Hydrogenedentes bacterium]|nr:PSD1 domain-containing protein [Candidatus Hydrogenedentota bacterium]
MNVLPFLRCTIVGVIAVAAGLAGGVEPSNPQDLEFFERAVRPVLSQYCYGCHGAEKQSGGLRMDHGQFIRTGGDSGPGLVAGDPAASRIWNAISYENVDLQMPPKGILPEEARASIQQWIERGAVWPDEPLPQEGAAEVFDLEQRRQEHWAWQPVTNPEPPAVRDARFAAHPVDRFLQAEREERGLATALEADRRVLARRAAFALTGLPPAPEVVDAFERDTSPDAYLRLLDRLINSTAFGERWARHWFDLVRYADTHGHEGDYPIRHSWTYRDYVIRALNDDVPYDQFVREHLAGDLLEEPRRDPEQNINESVLATGFWYMHQATHAPVDVKRDQADRIDNQIDVMSKTFLGMTVSCSRCHDHKFDAISARDYYSLAGHLYSARQSIAFLDPGQKIQSAAFTHRALLSRQARAVREAILNTPDIDAMPVAPYLQGAARVLFDAPIPSDGVEPPPAKDGKAPEPQAGRPLEKVAEEMALDADHLHRWVAALREPDTDTPAHPLHAWKRLARAARTETPEAIQAIAAELAAAPADPTAETDAGVVYATFDGPDFEGWFTSGDAFGAAPSTPDAWAAPENELAPVAPGAAHSGLVSGKLQGILRSPTFTIDSDYMHFRVAGRDTRIRLVVDGYQLRFDNGLLFDDTLLEVGNTLGAFAWRTMGKQVGKYRGRTAYIEFIDESDGYIAVDTVVFSDDPTPPSPGARFHRDGLIPADVTEPGALLDALAQNYERMVHLAWRNHAASLPALAGDPVSAMLIRRGLWWNDESRSLRDQLRDEIAASGERIAAPLKALAMEAGTPQDAEFFIRGDHRNVSGEVPRGYLAALEHETPQPTPTRLDLANRIADPKNPLTARVYVNRVFHHLFGRGIVPSVDNFGVLGQPPSHPELLDYLATRFMEEGWSTKWLIRFLMETETYRMSGVPIDAAAEASDPANVYLHRMRVQRLEGEAIRDALLAVAGNLDATMYGPSIQAYVPPFEANRRSPASGPMDGNRRRTIYLEVRRNHLLPIAAVFDMPVPDTTIGARTVSNLPAQALILMNDPFVTSQAQVWSERLILEHHPDPASIMEALFQTALARSPRDDERGALAAFVESQAALYGVAAEEAWRDTRVLADLCHTVFMLKEFIYIG